MDAKPYAASSLGAFRRAETKREGCMTAILIFFGTHWTLSILAQTFFLHRYGAHRMFTMNRFWDRFFYLFSFIAQSPSFLVPRAYAILHREHHAFSDTE